MTRLDEILQELLGSVHAVDRPIVSKAQRLVRELRNDRDGLFLRLADVAREDYDTRPEGPAELAKVRRELRTLVERAREENPELPRS